MDEELTGNEKFSRSNHRLLGRTNSFLPKSESESLNYPMKLQRVQMDINTEWKDCYMHHSKHPNTGDKVFWVKDNVDAIKNHMACLKTKHECNGFTICKKNTYSDLNLLTVYFRKKEWEWENSEYRFTDHLL